MLGTRIVLATKNGLGGSYIRQYFDGADGAAIVVLIEGSSQDSEVDTWNYLKVCEPQESRCHHPLQ